MKKLFVIPLFMAAFAMNAQEKTEPLSTWYIGLGTGVQFNSMRFSNLNKDRYPTKKGLSSPVWSIFVQKEFGNQRQFVVRPQISFLNRGGKLADIGRFSGYNDESIKDVTYQLKSHYVDIRVPLLYQFLKADKWFRPYAGLTPVLGFSTGGNIRLQTEYNDLSINGYETNLNGNNFSSTYFALTPTVGARFNFPVGKRGQNIAFVNLELGYEIGLTDTYSSKEKNGEATNLVGRNGIKFDGTRKFSGFNIQILVGIPLSVFKSSKAEVPAAPLAVRTHVAEIKPVTEPDKSCYTLEEITDFIRQNKSVTGKRICSIDDINFDFNKNTIKRESYSYLNQLAELIVKTGKRIKVNGHTDNVGTEEYNLNLSRQRAEAVMQYLVKHGVDQSNISIDYYGSSRPLTTNDTEAGRKLNRRVEFEILN